MNIIWRFLRTFRYRTLHQLLYFATRHVSNCYWYITSRKISRFTWSLLYTLYFKEYLKIGRIISRHIGSCSSLNRPSGFQEFKCSRFHGSRHMKVSLTHRPPLPPRKYSCWRLSRPQGHSAARRIMSMENSYDTIGNRTRDLSACSSLPQPALLVELRYVKRCCNQLRFVGVKKGL
jgi:hypothetical protein